MTIEAHMETTWAYFDHVVCVNLDRRPDRWAEAQAELAHCGIATCERFSAIDRCGMPGALGQGAAGCSASHRTIWRRIANGECGARVLVLEDDFMLITRELLLRVGYTPEREEVQIFDSLPGATASERFRAILPSIPPTWDLLYLGGGYQTPPLARTNRYLIRNEGMHTTHAYAIGRRMAQLVTDHLDAGYGAGTERDPAVYAGASDSVLAELSKRSDVLSYTMTPRLFLQRPTSQSDLNPQPVGFPWDQVDSRHERMV